MADSTKILEISRPAAGKTRVYGEEFALGSDIQMRFDLKDTSQLDAVAEGDNLVINFNDGARVELQDFYKKFSKEQQLLGLNGQEELSAYLEALVDRPIETALGPSATAALNSARHIEYDNLELLEGVNHLRELDWGMQGGAAPDGPRQTFADDGGGTTGGNLLAFGEDGTPQPDMLVTSVTFGGRDVAVPASGEPVTIEGGYGSLTVQSNGDYEYTPTKDVDSEVVDEFSYTLEDSVGTTFTADITIEIDGNPGEPPVPDDSPAVAGPAGEESAATTPDVSPGVPDGDDATVIAGDSGSQPSAHVQNIGLVVDTSSSMWSQLPDGTSRFDATMGTLRGMIGEMAEKVTDDPSLTVNISLVEFSDVAQLHSFGEGGAWLSMNADNAGDMVALFNAKLDAISSQFVFDGFPSAHNRYGEIPLETVKNAINEHFGFAKGTDDYLHITREQFVDVLSANQWKALDDFNLVDHQTNYQVAFDEALAAFSNPPAASGATVGNSLYFMSDGSPNRFVPANAGPENGADLGIEDWGIIAMLDGGYDGLIQDPGTNATLYGGAPFPSMADSVATLEGIYGKTFTAAQRALVEAKLEQFRTEFTNARDSGAMAEFSFVAGIKGSLETFIAENPAVYSPSFGALVGMGVAVEAVAWAGTDADFNISILNSFAGGEATLVDSEEGLGDFLDAGEMLTPKESPHSIGGSTGDGIIHGEQDSQHDNPEMAEPIADGSDTPLGGSGNDAPTGEQHNDTMSSDAADPLDGSSGFDVMLVDTGAGSLEDLLRDPSAMGDIDGVDAFIAGEGATALTDMGKLQELLGIRVADDGTVDMGEHEVQGTIEGADGNYDVYHIDSSAGQVEIAVKQMEVAEGQ